MWWIKSAPVPPALVATGSLNDPLPGFLGQPGTVVLFGNQNVDLGRFSGVRSGFGLWLMEDQWLGVEGNGFLLETRTATFTVRSDSAGNPLLVRPFFDALTDGNPAVYDLANSQFGQSGGISIGLQTRLWGTEANLFGRLYTGNRMSVEWLLGARQLSLRESLRITDEVFPGFGIGSAPVDGPSYTHDQFDTSNQMYGGQVGFRLNWVRGPLAVMLTGKVALAANNGEVQISGLSTFAEGGATLSTPGGILALSSNSGLHRLNDLVVIPEAGLNVGWQILPCLQARAGYSFLYINRVLRPGPQIDPVLNPGLVPTDPAFLAPTSQATRPAFLFHQSEFWAHGLNLGLEFCF